MFAPDLGGGRWLRRRSRSLSIGFFHLFLLVSLLLPSSTPDLVESGDSVSLVWVLCNAPPVFTASSMARTPSRSPHASASGRCRSVDREFHRLTCSCQTESKGSRSVVKVLLMIDPNPRSEPYSSLRLRLISALARFCSSPCKSEKSRSFSNPFLSPMVVCSKRSYSFYPIEAHKLGRCSSRKGRYKLPTPIVWNLYSKFSGDFGVLHGCNSVMGKIYLPSDILFRRAALNYDCSYHRISAEYIIGRYYRCCHKYHRSRAALLSSLSGWKFLLISNRNFYHQRVAVCPEFFDSASSGRNYCDASFGIRCYLLGGLLHKTDLIHQHEPPESHRFVLVVEAACVLLYKLGRTPKFILGLICSQMLNPTGHEPIHNTAGSKGFQMEKGLTLLLLVSGLHRKDLVGNLNCWISFHLYSHIVLGVFNGCIVSSAFIGMLVAGVWKNQISENMLY